MDGLGAVWSTSRENDKLARQVERLIQVTGVGPVDRITVAGHKTLSVFVGLCERNFLHVCCRASAAGPHVEENDADSLWIVDVSTEPELISIVRPLCRDVRPGGTVVIGLSALTAKTFPFRLRHLLIQSGFSGAQQRAVMIGGEDFLVARKAISLHAIAAERPRYQISGITRYRTRAA
jgi:hypothetical protein